MSGDRPIALVTGANRGIGLEVVRQLAVGDHVVLASRDAGRGREAALRLGEEVGVDIDVVRLDVADPIPIDDAVASLDAAHGRLDVLVNNAAIHYDTWQRASAPDVTTIEEGRVADVRRGDPTAQAPADSLVAAGPGEHVPFVQDVCPAPAQDHPMSTPASTSTSTSTAESSVRAELDAVATAWDAAIVADDPDAIGRYAEPDWVLIGATGILTRDRFVEVVRSGRLTHHTMSHVIHDVRLFGDVAVVVSRVRNTGAFDCDEFTNDEWTTDVYVRRSGTWRCSVTQLTAAVDPPAA